VSELSGQIQASPASPRSERVISHALVDVRRWSWWPFGVQSAVLLDLSQSGFKIEFTGSARCAVDDDRVMQIPLAPFGIQSPSHISCNVRIRWFDAAKMRVGGTFEEMDPATRVYLDKIIEHVKNHGFN
jgi:hypothetical protein